MADVCSIVGARPQFIKAAPLSRALSEVGLTERLIHTGQHYDYEMSGVFLQQLGFAPPAKNLGVGSGSHGEQTGLMLIRLEQALLEERPDIVVVFGDTNSTLAGALAACKLHIPVAHIEAGLRSNNRRMPEELNRVMVDHVSDLLFAPTEVAIENLASEGIVQGVHQVGDVMVDALNKFSISTDKAEAILREYEVTQGSYLLVTVHRPQNADNPDRLLAILDALEQSNLPALFPAHPRTRQVLNQLAEEGRLHTKNTRVIDPVGYLEMLALESNAAKIVTDSGGVQKEAFVFAIPCITLRQETEWVETVEAGWNILVDADTERILTAIRDFEPSGTPPAYYGDGRAAQHIASVIDKYLE